MVIGQPTIDPARGQRQTSGCRSGVLPQARVQRSMPSASLCWGCAYEGGRWATRGVERAGGQAPHGRAAGADRHERADRQRRPLDNELPPLEKPLREGLAQIVGQPVDLDQLVLVSARRDAQAARRFFQRALTTLKVTPSEVVTDAAAVYPAVLDGLVSVRVASHRTVCQQPHRSGPRPAQAPAAADARPAHLERAAALIIAGHAFIQNLRRGHYELGPDTPPALRVTIAFAELARAI